MTRDDIIRMFNEAGESAGWKPGLGNELVINYLTHFAALVTLHEMKRLTREKIADCLEIMIDDEREEIARMADERVHLGPDFHEFARDIRARGQA